MNILTNWDPKQYAAVLSEVIISWNNLTEEVVEIFITS